MTRLYYLYGNLVDKDVHDTQKSIAKAKIKACYILVDDIFKAPSEHRDEDKLRDLLEAIEFNKKLLNEEY